MLAIKSAADERENGSKKVTGTMQFGLFAEGKQRSSNFNVLTVYLGLSRSGLRPQILLFEKDLPAISMQVGFRPHLEWEGCRAPREDVLLWRKAWLKAKSSLSISSISRNFVLPCSLLYTVNTRIVLFLLRFFGLQEIKSHSA